MPAKLSIRESWIRQAEKRILASHLRTTLAHFDAMKISLLSLLLAVTPFTILGADDPTTITGSKISTDKSTGVTVVKGTIELPRKGSWSISGPYEDHQGLTEIYLASDDEELADFEGERMAQMEDRRVAKEGAKRSVATSQRMLRIRGQERGHRTAGIFGSEKG